MIKKLSLPKISLSKPDFSKVKFSRIREISSDKFIGIKILAVLSYIHILVIIPLLFKKKNEFIDYHVRQGIALLVAWIVLSFTFYIPVIPIIVAFYIIISMIIGIVNVCLGKERPIPFMGRYVR